MKISAKDFHEEIFHAQNVALFVAKPFASAALLQNELCADARGGKKTPKPQKKQAHLETKLPDSGHVSVPSLA